MNRTRNICTLKDRHILFYLFLFSSFVRYVLHYDGSTCGEYIVALYVLYHTDTCGRKQSRHSLFAIIHSTLVIQKELRLNFLLYAFLFLFLCYFLFFFFLTKAKIARALPTCVDQSETDSEDKTKEGIFATQLIDCEH